MMETPQNQPQAQPPSVSTPSTGAHGNDLYAAITAEDEAPVVVEKKKHQSPFMTLVVGFMKLTFWMDLTRRSNESAFKALRYTWGTLIGILYLSGIITLFLCIVSFVSLPSKIEKFFNENNIKYSSLEMVDYSLTQIEIKDLHDDKNTYQIPTVHIRSTFSDFLKNKILGVEAEGVKINLNPAKTSGNELGWLMNVFATFNQKNPQKLSINALNISQAVLTIMGKNITLPVAFSLVGDYTQVAKTTAILFNINEDFLATEGNLSISGEGTDRTIEITIKSGALKLPNSPEENLEGKITIQTSGSEIQTIEGTINLSYAHTKKEIQIKAEKEEKGFSGDFSYLLKNNVSDQSEETLMDFSIIFKGLEIDNQQNLITKEPLKIMANTLNQNNLELNNIETTLNGKLVCAIPDGKCEYELEQKSNLKIGVVQNNYKDQQIIFNDNKSIEIYPKEKTSFMWQLNPFSFKMNFTAKNIDSYGYLNTEKSELDLLISEMDFESTMNMIDTNLALNIKNGQFVSPSWQLKNINLSSKDIFDGTLPLTITADHVQTTSKILKKPFHLDMTTLSGQSVVDIKVDETDIKLKAKGALDPLKGTFSGQFILYPIQLETLNFSLNDLSDLFLDTIKEPSGDLIARGQVKLSGHNNIMGPMYFGLRNVNFKVDETSFKNVNTVMVLQSLKPIQSTANQPFFIEKIQSLSDLYNISGVFQLTNKNIRFNNIEGQVANQDVFLNLAIIPLDNPSGSYYLKSEKTFNTNEMTPYVDLGGAKVSDGLSSLAIEIKLASDKITLPSTTLKLSEASLTPKVNGSDALELFTKGQTRYFVHNGVLTLTKGNHLQAELDGWYLPYSKKKSFSEDVTIQDPLFKESERHNVPQKIEDLLNKVFH